VQPGVVTHTCSPLATLEIEMGMEASSGKMLVRPHLNQQTRCGATRLSS
jgi:hypothetical protein